MAETTTMTEEADPEYDDLVKAQKHAKRILKANHYRIIDIPASCQCCKYSTSDYDSGIQCSLTDNTRWEVGDVSDFGLCDKYERKTI
jgi:predicted Zn-ribbon and HTH transcriptional regulator